MILDESKTRSRYWRDVRSVSHASDCCTVPRRKRSRIIARPNAEWKFDVLHRTHGNPFVLTCHLFPRRAEIFTRAYRCAGCASAATCAEAVGIATKHVRVHGWETCRHSAHTTTDFSVYDCAPLAALLREVCCSTVLPTLAALYFDDADRVELRVEDCFFVKYDGAEGRQRGLGAHRDGSLLSFSIAMNAPTAFAGGGTFFAHGERGGQSARAASSASAPAHARDSERRAAPCPAALGAGSGETVVRPTAVGDLIAHCGKLVHGGVALARGVRYILVGFVKCSGGAASDAFLDSMTVDRSAARARERERGGGGRERAVRDWSIVREARRIDASVAVCGASSPDV